MDPTAAHQYLSDYWTLVCQTQKQSMLSKERRAMIKDLNQRLRAVNVIFRSLAPDFVIQSTANRLSDHLEAGPHIYRALEILAAWKRMGSHHWTGGGPALPLSLLDPVITDAALPLWKVGKYRQAVNDAATSLNLATQNRIVRHDISDKDLMAQIFSDKEPQPGKSRLRCPGNPDSETVRSTQEGARAYAIGAFQAIRNPAHHLTGDWNPITAFHHLASLSQVAQWVRHWTVDYYVPSMPDFPSIIEADPASNPYLAKMIKVAAQMQAPPPSPGG